MLSTSDSKKLKEKKQKQLPISHFFSRKCSSESSSGKYFIPDIKKTTATNQSKSPVFQKKRKKMSERNLLHSSSEKTEIHSGNPSIVMDGSSISQTENSSSAQSSRLLAALEDADNVITVEIPAAVDVAVSDGNHRVKDMHVGYYLHDETRNQPLHQKELHEIDSAPISDETLTVCPESPMQINNESQDEIDIKEFLSLEARSTSSVPLCLGMPFAELKVMPDCCNPLPELKQSPDHTLLFDETQIGDGPPRPRNEFYHDAWDSRHVRLPCSPKNVYPLKNRGQESLANRWELIESSLLAEISSSIGLEEAILTYNSRYSKQWSFSALHRLFLEEVDSKYAETFFNQTLPEMIKLALRLPSLCTQPIPLLKSQRNHRISMTQQQIACLLCNAFLCTFPWRNSRRQSSEYSNYPEINFTRLFMSGSSSNTSTSEKLKTLIHYFERVTTEMPTGTVTFERRSLDEFPCWNQSPCQLCGLHLHNEGRIETEGSGMLQVDFANRFIGGGVLGGGSVQEEIRFCICPELIVSMLFTEAMDENECVVITGAEQFSSYVGYASSYQWAGNFIDAAPRDEWGRRRTQIVAMDAIYFPRPSEQYTPRHVRRELNKAFCGFFCNFDPDNSPAIATGNWGCGAFNGNPVLKGLIQLMAAAAVGRDLCYFTFNDGKLSKTLHEMHCFIKKNQLQISDLWSLLVRYNNEIASKRSKDYREDLFPFIKRVYNLYTDSTDEDMF